MKKMLIAAAIVLTAGIMASCNKGEGCYKLTGKYQIAGVSAEQTLYVYGDGEDIDLAKKNLKATIEKLGGDAKITQVKVAKSEEDCHE